MEILFIAIIWGFIWWLSWIILHYYNLRKERFFKLQEKWEELLKVLYEYQDVLLKVDLLKDDVEIESIWIKTEEQLQKFKYISSIHQNEADKKQKLREKIWTLINIYFPFLEQDFREYTTIELNHHPDLELNPNTLNSRENKIWEIWKKLILNINKERTVFLFFKI